MVLWEFWEFRGWSLTAFWTICYQCMSLLTSYVVYQGLSQISFMIWMIHLKTSELIIWSVLKRHIPCRDISIYCRSVNLFEPLNLSLAWNGIISLEIKALDVQAGEHWRPDDTTHTNRSVMTHEEPLLFFLSFCSLWRWDRYWSYRRTVPRCRERERPKHRQTERERGLGDRQT